MHSLAGACNALTVLRGTRRQNILDVAIALLLLVLIGRLFPGHVAISGTAGPITAGDVTSIIDEIDGGPADRTPLVLARGPVTFRGWAAATVKHELPIAVDVVIDGAARFPAQIGLGRPDVAQAYNAPSIAASGFRVAVPSSAISPGSHDAAIEATSADGTRAIVSRHFTFFMQSR
jgi:hypothetical protein